MFIAGTIKIQDMKMSNIDTKSFCRLSGQTHVPVMHEGVMALLCTMRSPEGLTGQNKFRKVAI